MCYGSCKEGLADAWVTTRIDLGLRLEDVSRVTGINKFFLSGLENGRYPITEETEERYVDGMCRLFNKLPQYPDKAQVLKACEEVAFVDPRRVAADELLLMDVAAAGETPFKSVKFNPRDKYDTVSKKKITFLQGHKIQDVHKGKTFTLLCMPYNGRELRVFLNMFKMKIDIKNSQGVEKFADQLVLTEKMLKKHGWALPMHKGDVDDYVLGCKPTQDVILLDYNGYLIDSHVDAVDHIITNCTKETQIYVTLNTNTRGKKDAIRYKFGKPPFKRKVDWYQPYYGVKNALMDMFLIHVK